MNRIGEGFEAGAPSELGVDARAVDDVVSVAASRARREHGREVQPVDAEIDEVGQQRERVGEAEVSVQLQAVGGDGRTRHFSGPLRAPRSSSRG